MSKNISEHKNLKNGYIYISELFLFFLAALFFIPTMDDIHFSYGLKYGSCSELLHNAFYYGNGRILGNLFGMFFANHRLLSAVFKTTVLALLTECVHRFFECKENIRSFIFLAFVITSPYLFGDTIAWNSAFCNYIPPILFTFTSLLLLKNYKTEVKKSNKILNYIVGAVISFGSQLFIEHIALVNAFLFTIITIYYIKNENKKYYFSIFMLLFFVAGLFTTAFLPKLLPHENLLVKGYQESISSVLNLDKLIKLIIGTFSLAAKEISLDIPVFSFISVCIILALKKSAINKKLKNLLTVSQILYPILVLLSIIFSEQREMDAKIEFWVNGCRVSICVIYILSIFISSMILIKDKKNKLYTILILFSAFISLPPAALSGTAYYRTTYFMHFSFILIGIILYKELKTNYGFDFKKLNVYANSCFIILLAVMIGVYANQYSIYREKEESLENQINNNQMIIYLPELNSVLTHIPNTQSLKDKQYNKFSFDNYHENLPAYKYMPYKEWKEFISENH